MRGKFGSSLLPLGGLWPRVTAFERMFPLVLDVNSYITACSAPLSSKNYTVCLTDEDGKEMGYPTFPNTLSGAKAPESQLLQLIQEKGFSTLKIATEATSFLDLHLVDSLASSQDLAFNPSIYQFNPKVVRNFKRAYPDKEKTDKIDAFVITDQLRFLP
jgi:hypothetical protein